MEQWNRQDADWDNRAEAPDHIKDAHGNTGEGRMMDDEYDEFFQRSREIEERRARQRQRTSEAAQQRRRRRERQIQQAKARLILAVTVAFAIVLIGLLVTHISRSGAGKGNGTDGAALMANAAADTAGIDGNSADAGDQSQTSQGDIGSSQDSDTTGMTGQEGALGGSTDVRNRIPSEEQIATDRAAKNYSAAVANFWPYDTFHTTDATQTIVTVDADAAADAPVGSVVSTYGIVVNADTGDIIAQREMDEKIVPASMTKVMTLLVAVETLGLTEDSPQLHNMVTLTTADEEYAYVNGSSAVCWMPGDTASVEDLMYGTILPSGADAAMALAEYTAGSADDFVKLMNEKAQELGISGTTHFTNCVGTYDDNHYSTVYDVAVIMKAALENDLCRKVLSEHTWTTSPTSEHPEGITVSNWFLRRIEDKDTHGVVLCAKTGYVNESGFCAVSYQESDDGSQLIVCTAASSGNWRCINDHVSLYQKYAKEVQSAAGPSL